jgi:hypothetical protein
MREVLPDPHHVTPEWLTEVLQDQGHWIWRAFEDLPFL